MAKKGTRKKGKQVKGPDGAKFVLVRMDDIALHQAPDEDGDVGEGDVGFDFLEEAKDEAASLAEEAGCEVAVYQYVGMFIPPEEIPPQWSDD